jgi:hypothetical protein
VQEMTTGLSFDFFVPQKNLNETNAEILLFKSREISLDINDFRKVYGDS